MFNILMKLHFSLKILEVLFVMVYNVKSNNVKEHGLIYVLLWSGLNDSPFVYWLDKRKSFISNNCTFQNCYIVKNRDYFFDVTDYDAIIINISGLKYNQQDLPSARSDNQLYVFAAMEPAAYWTLPEEELNYLFNYTMSYRLDSDIAYPYFMVKNKRGEIIGPKINAHFRNWTRMRPTMESVIDKLKNKTKAAAWFVTNCYDKNHRLTFGHGINKALSKYNLNVDIFGRCGNNVCTRGHNACLDLLEKYYYFYFSFENSNCEDYVSEKLMTALSHYAVPVIYGGANYSRFMPAGIYIDGNILTEEDVATKIHEAIQNKQRYYDYFRWRHYYTYQPTEGGESDPICSLCALLNDESVRNQRRVYARFTQWWNDYRSPNEAEEFVVKYEDSASYIKGVLTYREKKIQPQTSVTSSTLDLVNNFVDDLTSYFFGE